MKVSIIVPIWNLEKYLDEMIQSVLQSMENDFELLLVDNGSTDRSGEIIDSYANGDARIQKLFCEKRGAAAARNVGLEHATGRYVVFVDGDDAIAPDYLSKLTDAMEQNDIVMADCGYTTEYLGKVVDRTSDDKNQTETAEAFLERLFTDDEKEYDGFIWNKIFIRDIIEKKQLRFDENISFNEDRLFLTAYLLEEKQIKRLPDCLYHYRVREDSAMSATREYFASENEMTEIVAFEKILGLAEPDSTVWMAVRKNMAYAQIRLFKRMIDEKQWARYRKSLLRKYARTFYRLAYEPRNKEEKMLCRKYVFFGWTGISYGKRNG